MTADARLNLTQQQIRQAQQGEKGILDDLFRRYLPRVRAMVAARLGQTVRQFADQEDIVQETFRDALLGLGQIDHETDGAFVCWLARCVENNIRDQRRRQSALKRGAGRVRAFANLAESRLSESLFAGNEDPASVVAQGKEMEERLELALLQMGARYREVILLRVHGGLSHKEIAAAMGLPSENTANVLFLRARARLQEILETSGGGGTHDAR